MLVQQGARLAVGELGKPGDRTYVARADVTAGDQSSHRRYWGVICVSHVSPRRVVPLSELLRGVDVERARGWASLVPWMLLEAAIG